MNIRDAREKLLARTKAGDVNWRPTEQRNAVAVRFEGASIVLINHEVSEKEVVSLQDLFGSTMTVSKSGISLEFRNVEGKTVGRLNAKPDGNEYETLKELWQLAYGKAYRVAETFDAIEKILSSEGEIG